MPVPHKNHTGRNACTTRAAICVEWFLTMRKLVLFLAVVAMAWPLAAATTKRKTTKRRTHTAITPSRKAPKSSRMRRPKSTTIRPKPHTRTSYQNAPTPERYKEIQQALVEKGYLQGEPNGEWSTDSVGALKRFQADQNLTPDGKISSLSLIALGLGPRRLTADSSAHIPAEAPKAELPK